MKSRIPDEYKPFNANAIPCHKGCGKTFSANRNEEHLGELGDFGAVTRVYMECPHCSEQYNVGFINLEVETMITDNVALSKIKTKEARANFRRNRKKGIKIMDQIEAAWRRSLEDNLSVVKTGRIDCSHEN